MKMKRVILVLLAGACGSSGLADVAATNSIDKYKIIIDKSPFKRTADPALANVTPLAGTMTLSGIYADGETKKVWLKDTKTNKNISAIVGETVMEYHVD